ncbi:thioesterase II family protein [Bradyrhizobium prioriisuperbiae]|uniref:thioesterase II family protein n=1 Tax=Bradyrhizobium prioriisuperbiae TaxID=2854389 RepID=UPI003898FAE7
MTSRWQRPSRIWRADWHATCGGGWRLRLIRSLGALVAFSLAQRLESIKGGVPTRLVLCGARPPSSGRISPWHLLSRSELIDRLKTLGGLADRVLENEEVLDAILPLIQADLSIAENWQTADGHAGSVFPSRRSQPNGTVRRRPRRWRFGVTTRFERSISMVVPGTISSRTPGQRNLSHWLTARGLPLAKD